MVEHMVVAILIALWMRLQSLLVVVEPSPPSCNGSMLQVKKRVALRLEHLMLMPALFRFSPSIWQRELNGMLLLSQDLLKELSLGLIHQILIIGLPMNDIFHSHCEAIKIFCLSFLGTQQLPMQLRRRQLMHLLINVLISRCGRRSALAMSPSLELAHISSAPHLSGEMVQNLSHRLFSMRRCKRLQVLWEQ